MKKITLGLAVLCFIATDAFAFGDGLFLNGAKVEPRLTLTSKHDDNIANKETGAKSSFISIINPAVDVAIGSGIKNATLGYSFEKGDYSLGNADNYEDHFANVGLHNEISAKSIFDFGVGYSQTHDPRGSATGIADSGSPDKWQQYDSSVGYTLGGIGALGKLVFDGSYENKRYVNHIANTEGRNLDTKGAGATFFYQMSAKTSSLVEVRYANYNYALSTSKLDSTEMTYYVGLAWEATAKTMGTAKVGTQSKNFKDPTQKMAFMSSWDVAVSWAPLTYSTVDFGSTYMANESDGAVSFIKTNDMTLVWNHKWNKRFSHVVNLGYMQKRYENNATRKDNTSTSGLTFNYEAKTWLSVEASYNSTTLDSTVVNTSYTKNEAALTFVGTL